MSHECMLTYILNSSLIPISTDVFLSCIFYAPPLWDSLGNERKDYIGITSSKGEKVV